MARITDPGQLAEAVRAGNRAALARAVTLVESRKSSHRAAAQDLLERLLPETGRAIRLGITGVPGVGKSTLIDELGTNLTAQGHRVAVLAVDPSSTRTGGSILGDKTRMERLSRDPQAFVRPSPAAGTLGGVAAKTREAMLLCEAAGFDVVIVETVGTGQSETTVAEMVDSFLVLTLPGAGDELQGIKKGVLEIADIIAVNKGEGENAVRARSAASELRAALHILAPAEDAWSVPVLVVSGLSGDGLDPLWATVLAHRDALQKADALAPKRHAQQVRWMWALVEEALRQRLMSAPGLKGRLPEIEASVREGRRPAGAAARELLALAGLSEG